jgi:hypothetical protein
MPQDLLECVDPDVKQGLLFQGFEVDRVVSRAMPRLLDGLQAPQGFEFVGSSESNLQTNAAYKTALASDAALDAMVDALRADGWTAAERPGMRGGGFVSSAQPALSMVCRGDDMATVMSRESSGATFVNLTMAASSANVSCNATSPSPTNMFPGGAVGRFLPRLSLPADARNAAAGFGLGGGSSSNRSASTSVAVDTQLTPQELLAHFEQQLRDQGWNSDASWSGRLSAGSAWSARPEADVQLAGLLDIVDMGASGHQATFRATQID